jgi:DNA polymerase
MTQWLSVERGEDSLSPAHAISVLQWWMDAGVDCLVDEQPRDWLRPKPKPEAVAPAAVKVAEAPSEELPGQLDLFQAWLASHDQLSFAAPSAPRVCPSGDPNSGLMMMTDMPSAEDCSSGTLLSGEVGRLFERMLAAIGRDRASIYFAALSCLRSASGQFTSGSARECAMLARHHIGLVAPKALLLFGDACSTALLGLPMIKARGRWHEIQTHGGPVKTLVTLSPAFLLKQPAAKAHAWADLQMLVEGLK